MTDIINWHSGHNNYKKCSFVTDPATHQHKFHTEILDVDTEVFTNVNDIFNMHLSKRQTKVVEVLYSGGLDSELVLLSCVRNKIPVKAITMRLMINGFPFNTHDLYYAEKFCRENQIEHAIVDLDVASFFENGDHIKYLSPYLAAQPHVATHFWLFEQCTGYPVIGGEHSWPWTHQVALSPHRYQYSVYDRFLADNNIDGIGNMISHSLESNMFFVRTHLKLFNSEIHGGDSLKIPKLKQDMLADFGFNVEIRLRSYGWETVPRDVFFMNPYTTDLEKRFGITESSISWNKKMGDAISASPGSNHLYR